MESLKTCDVCFLSYDAKDRAPRVLSCGHTLCTECLTNILNNPTLRKCPFDNIAFAPSQNSLASFALNFIVIHMLEQKKSNTCKTHAGEKLKFICLTENLKICSECAHSEDHKEHRVLKIKTLKAQGAKLKRELQETLLNVRNCEQGKADDFEQIKKVFISAIDEQVKEVKNILVEKQFEWVQQVKNIFEADKKQDSEGFLGLKQQIDGTIKNITDVCQDDNGNLMILDKEIQSDQKMTKMLPKFLKDKSSRVQNSFFEMQKSFKESLEKSKIAINSLYLPSQGVIKEIYSVHEERKQLSQEELAKIHKELRSLKFRSHCDFTINSGCLNISFKHPQQRELAINLDDFQAIEAIDIELARCDMLKNESHPDVLSYIFHGVKKLVDLRVSFDPQSFNNEGLLWLGKTIQNHVHNLKKINLDLAKCKFDNQSMLILCEVIFSKTTNLHSFGINLDSCQITDADLKALIKYIKPIKESLTVFALGLSYNKISDDGIHQAFEIIKRMEALKELQLYLSGTNITNESFRILGENVLPSLKSLNCLPLFFSSSVLSDEALCIILKNLPNLKELDLYVSKTPITDKSMEMFIGEVLPRLESLKYFSFRAQGTQISNENLQIIQDIAASLENKRASDEDAN